MSNITVRCQDGVGHFFGQSGAQAWVAPGAFTMTICQLDRRRSDAAMAGPVRTASVTVQQLQLIAGQGQDLQSLGEYAIDLVLPRCSRWYPGAICGNAFNHLLKRTWLLQLGTLQQHMQDIDARTGAVLSGLFLRVRVDAFCHHATYLQYESAASRILYKPDIFLATSHLSGLITFSLHEACLDVKRLDLAGRYWNVARRIEHPR